MTCNACGKANIRDAASHSRECLRPPSTLMVRIRRVSDRTTSIALAPSTGALGEARDGAWGLFTYRLVKPRRVKP